MAAPQAISRRYAQAAFELATEKGNIEQWQTDLQTVKSLFADGQLAAVFDNPKYTHEEKAQALTGLLQGKVSPLVYNLIKLLVDRNRATRIVQVVDEFTNYYNRSRNIAIADVTTAVELSEPEKQQVAARLSRMTGQQIQLRAHVDPSILGGLVARIGDELIDASVQSRLEEMRRRLVAMR